jgi:hypothetical protein
MNKKLIKELEAAGFKFTEAWYQLFAESFDVCYHHYMERLVINKIPAAHEPSAIIDNPTFAQIAEKVLELTGVTLTPKQTKRQEIDTLRESVKMLDKENHEMGVYIAKNEKENQELGKRIDVLEKDKTFRAIEGIKDLMDQAVSMAFPKGGVSSATVHGGETILGKNIANTTKAEPKSEPEKTEGVFKVGDPVVIIHNPKNGLDANYINSAILNKTQHIITSEDARSNHLGTKINDAVYWFTPNDLQHAPKEAAKVLEFGDMLESLVDFDGVKIGQNVVFLSKSAKKYKEDVPEGLKKYHVIDEWTNHYFMTADSFKGFEPKEKVLEFGGWAELMQNLGGWAKGAKVLLISKVDQSPESVFKFFLCANGDGEHQKINSEQLKAL